MNKQEHDNEYTVQTCINSSLMVGVFQLNKVRVWVKCGCLPNSTQLNSTGHVTLTAKRDQKKGKKATAYQYPLSLI